MLLEIYPNYLGHFVNGYSHNVYLNSSLLLGKCVLCYVVANNYWGDMVKEVPSAPHSVELRLK